jgi:RNA polymerase sigma-70 factor (ECF subfamily)
MIGDRSGGHYLAVGDATLRQEDGTALPLSTLGGRPKGGPGRLPAGLAPAREDPEGLAPTSAGARGPMSDTGAASHARLRGMMAEHYDFIWRSLRRLGLDPDTADDTAQKVFMVASRKLEMIAEGSERAFLFSTAMRVASETRRSAARRLEVRDEGADPADPGPRADEMLDQQRARAALDLVLTEMPIDLRVVFVLYELEELTSAEVAALLGIPLGTASSRLRRAREEFHAVVKRLRARGAFGTPSSPTAACRPGRAASAGGHK